MLIIVSVICLIMTVTHSINIRNILFHLTAKNNSYLTSLIVANTVKNICHRFL